MKVDLGCGIAWESQAWIQTGRLGSMEMTGEPGQDSLNACPVFDGQKRIRYEVIQFFWAESDSGSEIFLKLFPRVARSARSSNAHNLLPKIKMQRTRTNHGQEITRKRTAHGKRGFDFIGYEFDNSGEV